MTDRWEETVTWYSLAVEKLEPTFNDATPEDQKKAMKKSRSGFLAMVKSFDKYVEGTINLEAMKDSIRVWYKAVRSGL